MFKNIKARYLFIAAALFFLLGIGLIILIPFVSSNIDTKPLVIVLVILFIISTALVQAATYKAFSKKRKRKYITKKYRVVKILMNY